MKWSVKLGPLVSSIISQKDSSVLSSSGLKLSTAGVANDGDGDEDAIRSRLMQSERMTMITSNGLWTQVLLNS